MNIKNEARIIDAIKEYNKFEVNLVILEEMRKRNEEDGFGLLFQQYTDGSGIHTDHFYKYGNYNVEMTKEILDAVIAIVERHKLILEDEIETL